MVARTTIGAMLGTFIGWALAGSGVGVLVTAAVAALAGVVLAVLLLAVPK